SSSSSLRSRRDSRRPRHGDRVCAPGDVLELACGPGAWTERLLCHATSVTAVDAARGLATGGRACRGVRRAREAVAALSEILLGQPMRSPAEWPGFVGLRAAFTESARR